MAGSGSGPVAVRSIWLQSSLVVGIMLRSNRAVLFRFLGKMASERMVILKSLRQRFCSALYSPPSAVNITP